MPMPMLLLLLMLLVSRPPLLPNINNGADRCKITTARAAHRRNFSHREKRGDIRCPERERGSKKQLIKKKVSFFPKKT